MGSPQPSTIGDYLIFLIPRFSNKSKRSIPLWPPDVFAISASLLSRSGAYCSGISNWPPQSPLHADDEGWVDAIEELGEKWRAASVNGKRLPAKIRLLWKTLILNWDTPIGSIPSNLDLCHCLMQLLAAADEASVGVGGEYPDEQEIVDEAYYLVANNLLEDYSTLCKEIHPSRVRVLPKMHTPLSGLTIRSHSFYLCLCGGEEVSPLWVVVGRYPEQTSMNLLIVPWPFLVLPAQFEESTLSGKETRNLPEEFGFFKFKQRQNPDTVATIQQIYQQAVTEMGAVNGIVLPELALTEQEHQELRQFVVTQERQTFLISGVGGLARSSSGLDSNRVCFDIPEQAPLTQSKHHRWKLDASQIRQYALGGRLSVDKSYWEHIPLGERQQLFVSFPSLVVSVLICEDLARPDPVGDLMRAVGPNLVIALLMDGPQLKGRWPERYAMALADDPGSSVLSVTSLGMSELSRPSQGVSRSRVIALWKDRSGTSTEIELPAGCAGIVLSLSLQLEEEWTADGRRDYKSAVFPTLSGIHAIKGKPEWFRV